MTKECTKCGEDKEIVRFQRVYSRSAKEMSGYRGKCKECEIKSRKVYLIQGGLEKTKIHRRKYMKRLEIKKRYSNNRLRYELANGEHIKEMARNSKLKKAYGITLKEYNKMLAKQDECCAICKTDIPNGKGNTFHVDHCHETGKVRGLLCSNCNTSLGGFKDNPTLLTKAIKYLAV